jgi:hypothetical protein
VSVNYWSSPWDNDLDLQLKLTKETGYGGFEAKPQEIGVPAELLKSKCDELQFRCAASGGGLREAIDSAYRAGAGSFAPVVPRIRRLDGSSTLANGKQLPLLSLLRSVFRVVSTNGGKATQVFWHWRKPGIIVEDVTGSQHTGGSLGQECSLQFGRR